MLGASKRWCVCVDACCAASARCAHCALRVHIQACGAADGDLLLIAAGTFDLVSKTLDKVRQFVAEQLGEVPAGKHNLLWVTDFPMFGWNEEEQRMEVSVCARLRSRVLVHR